MSNSFCAPRITLIQKIKVKCCRPSSLIRIDSKALAEILKSQTQENFRMVIHDKLILIPETQRWYNEHKSIEILSQINSHKDKIVSPQ